MGRSNQVDAITGVVGEIVESYTFSCNPERTYDYLPYILRLNVKSSFLSKMFVVQPTESRMLFVS